MYRSGRLFGRAEEGLLLRLHFRKIKTCLLRFFLPGNRKRGGFVFLRVLCYGMFGCHPRRFFRLFIL